MENGALAGRYMIREVVPGGVLCAKGGVQKVVVIAAGRAYAGKPLAGVGGLW